MTFIQLGPVLVVFLLSMLSIHSSMTQELITIHQTNITILQTNINCYSGCADPRKVWNNPCGSCHHSLCKYEGCLYTGPKETYWKPDPCTKCICDNGTKKCEPYECHWRGCEHYPKWTPPGECCLRCDYGDRYDACTVRPSWFYWFNRNDSTCIKLFRHECNRPYIYKNGKWYECIQQRGWRRASENLGCAHRVAHVGYLDTRKCVPRKINEDRIPKNYQLVPIPCKPIPIQIPSGITCHQNLTYIILILLLVNCL